MVFVIKGVEIIHHSGKCFWIVIRKSDDTSWTAFLERNQRMHCLLIFNVGFTLDCSLTQDARTSDLGHTIARWSLYTSYPHRMMRSKYWPLLRREAFVDVNRFEELFPAWFCMPSDVWTVAYSEFWRLWMTFERAFTCIVAMQKENFNSWGALNDCLEVLKARYLRLSSFPGQCQIFVWLDTLGTATWMQREKPTARLRTKFPNPSSSQQQSFPILEVWFIYHLMPPTTKLCMATLMIGHIKDIYHPCSS